MKDPEETKIVVIGAEAVGIETALYGRYLGYRVEVLPIGEVGGELTGTVGAFKENASPLGLAALRAQDASYSPPSNDEHLSQDRFRNQYLLPLAKTDLIADCFREQCTVQRITEIATRIPPGEGNEDGVADDTGLGEREEADVADSRFRVLVRDVTGSSNNFDADVLVVTINDDVSHAFIQELTERDSPAIARLHRVDSDALPYYGPSGPLRQLCSIFAKIVGRNNLDIYATIS